MTDAPEPRTKPQAIRSSMEQTYANARDKAGKALARTRDDARDSAKRVGDAVSDNPITLLVSGIAVGALAGALLPRSKREVETLRPVGKKISAAAGTAAKAAKDAGKSELAGLGLTKDAARSQATHLIDGVLKALTTAGTAAVDSRKKA